MPALSEYSNVYNTSLLILQQKGYRIWYQETPPQVWAEKDGWDFTSESSCGLLGLVSIFEFKNPEKWTEYWWRLDGPNVYQNLPRDKPEFVPVWQN